MKYTIDTGFYRSKKIGDKPTFDKEEFNKALKHYLRDYYDPTLLPLKNNKFLEIADNYILSPKIIQGFYFDNENDLKYFIQAILLAYRRKESGKPDSLFSWGGKSEWFIIDSEELHKKRKNITQPVLEYDFVIIIHSNNMAKYRTINETINNCLKKRGFKNKITFLCSTTEDKFDITLERIEFKTEHGT